MSAIRAYIKPFNMLGDYATDFIEVTDYVEKIGDMTIDSDSSGYDIGIYRNSGFSLQLNNRDGLFSDVGTPNTLFNFKRSGSLVKVTWDLANFTLTPTAADSMFDQYVSNETIIFEGLLSDESLTEDAKQERVNFRVLGFETLFINEKIPFSTLVLGDDIEDLLFKVMNVTNITDLLTVSAVNISVGLNQVPDAIAQLENKTVKSALDELLLLSNSVLYIENRIVYVAPRTAGATVEFTFYGPNAATGVENCQDVKNISNGQNKLFNFFTWRGSPQTAARNQSINKYKHKIKELSSDLFTDEAKQFLIMESLLDEFGFPKQEFDVTVNMLYETLDIQLLDKVNMDYPLQYIESEGFGFPICGVAICGEAVLPKTIFSFSMDPSKNFKVIKRTLMPEKRNISFRLREV